jgi:hypothetical protein
MKRIALVVLVAAVAATASAYLVPAPGILKSYAMEREKMRIQRLMVRGQTTFYGDEAKAAITGFKSVDLSGETTLNVSLAYKTADEKYAGRCAIEVQAPSGVPAEAGTISNVGGRLKVVGPELLSQKVQAALVCPLLFQKSNVRGDAAPLLLTFLESVGVDTSIESLGRYEKDIAYIIGAKPRDLTKPQFWVTKDAYRPQRLFGRYEGRIFEVRLLDYTLVNTNEWHPREIDVVQGDALLSKFIAEKAEPNVKISDAIF